MNIGSLRYSLLLVIAKCLAWSICMVWVYGSAYWAECVGGFWFGGRKWFCSGLIRGSEAWLWTSRVHVFDHVSTVLLPRDELQEYNPKESPLTSPLTRERLRLWHGCKIYFQFFFFFWFYHGYWFEAIMMLLRTVWVSLPLDKFRVLNSIRDGCWM